MKKYMLLTLVAAVGLLATFAPTRLNQPSHAQSKTVSENFPAELTPPVVFQAAGPSVASIQSSVDEFRATLGNPNNLNNPGPLATGRREINWDGGGGVDTTTAPVTPFNVFLNTRGGQFTTPGIGLSQAPPTGGAQGGLVGLFNNATYGKVFRAFSPLRLFTPVGSNVTEALFFVPGSNGNLKATVRGFGAVFTDVDQPNGTGVSQKQPSSTLVEFFDADGKTLFSGFVPSSPGDGNLSFFGIVFDEPRIASVRITAGNVPGGPNDDSQHDVVMMDDFLYSEPQLLP